jgi:hypothetical protein
MTLKSATPKTNAGYIQGEAIRPRSFSGGDPNATNLRHATLLGPAGGD